MKIEALTICRQYIIMTKFQVRKGAKYEIFLIDKLDTVSIVGTIYFSVPTTHHIDWD